MKKLDTKNFNLEIYTYESEKGLFSYDKASELAHSRTYFVTADLIKIVRKLNSESIKFTINQNNFIKLV